MRRWERHRVQGNVVLGLGGASDSLRPDFKHLRFPYTPDRHRLLSSQGGRLSAAGAGSAIAGFGVPDLVRAGGRGSRIRSKPCADVMPARQAHRT
jgi:hypothetical protein